MEPAELHVEPGGTASTTVTVRNRGSRIEQFRLGVNGPLSSLVAVHPPQLSVYTDADESAVVTFTVPRASWPPAGRAPFQVVVHSTVHADVTDRTVGAVTVGRFDQLQASLEPEMTRGRRPGLHRVSLRNAGNAPLTVDVGLTDREGELTYDPPGFAVPIAAGATEVGDVRVGAAIRWFGRVTSLPFTATATAAGLPQPVLLNGVRRQLPRFPWWIPTAALAALALLIALIAILPGATVPNVGALTRAAAVTELEEAGYEVGEIEKPDEVLPAGAVIGTQPEGGAEHPKGERVQLFISAGTCSGPCPVTVPNVDGLTTEEAQADLTAAQFVVDRLDPVQNDRPAGQVISTNPAGGTMANLGTGVVITVSTGPAVVPTTGAVPPTNGGGGAGGGGVGVPLTMPDVLRRTADAADKELTDLGLTVERSRTRSNRAPLDTVLLSDPPAGSPVQKGATVRLTLAEPTGRVDLLPAAFEAEWSSTNGPPPAIPLTFPGDPGDVNGFALILPAAALEDGTTAEVLETHPLPQPDGTITGAFTLAGPTIAGDHLRADVGFLADGTDDAVFVVAVDGQELARVEDSATDGELKPIDAALPVGTTVVEIRVLAGPVGDKDETVWKDLRIEGQIG